MASLVLRNPENIPDVHHTQRTDPLKLQIRLDQSEETTTSPKTIQLQVDTLPRVPGKKVILTPEIVLLDPTIPEWVSIAVQPQQLSYHAGCDLKLEFFAIDPETKERLPNIKPFVTKPMTLKSRPIVENNNKTEHPKGEEEDIKAQEQNVKLWVKASVEYMKIAAQKEEDEITESPIQQLLVKQYINLNI